MSKENKVCSFCNKEFARKYNYSRHLQTCKLKPSEEIKNAIDVLKKNGFITIQKIIQDLDEPSNQI